MDWIHSRWRSDPEQRLDLSAATTNPMEGRALPRIVPADVAKRLGAPLSRMIISVQDEALVIVHSLAVLGAFYYAAPLAAYLLTKLSPRSRWILLAVLVTAVSHPSLREYEWIRKLPFWSAWHRYFSTRVVDENKPAPIPRRALLAAVPHGSFPFGAAMGLTGWLSDYFGPLRPIAASATGLVPVLRHTMEGLGGIHATGDAMRTAMLDGRPREMGNAWASRASASRGAAPVDHGIGKPSGNENSSTGLFGGLVRALGFASEQLLGSSRRGERARGGILPGSRADRGSERFLVQPGGIAEMYRGTVMDVPMGGSVGAGSSAAGSTSSRSRSGASQQLDAAMGRSRSQGGSRPEVILLKNRKGFVRVALESGIPLVPVYIFGCSTAMSIGWLSKRLEWLSRLVKASLVVFMGRWGLPIPRRSRFLYAIGKPLFEAPRVPGRPTKAEVDALHARFVQAIVGLFHRYKAAAGWPKKELIVK